MKFIDCRFIATSGRFVRKSYKKRVCTTCTIDASYTTECTKNESFFRGDGCAKSVLTPLQLQFQRQLGEVEFLTACSEKQSQLLKVLSRNM